MNDIRGIKVEKCYDCPRWVEQDCNMFDWQDLDSIPDSCPLPPWPSVTFRRVDKTVNIPQWPGDGDHEHGPLTILGIEFDFNGKKWHTNAVTGERQIDFLKSIGVIIKERNE